MKGDCVLVKDDCSLMKDDCSFVKSECRKVDCSKSRSFSFLVKDEKCSIFGSFVVNGRSMSRSFCGCSLSFEVYCGE